MLMMADNGEDEMSYYDYYNTVTQARASSGYMIYLHLTPCVYVHIVYK